jgi:hypothetical protein
MVSNQGIVLLDAPAPVDAARSTESQFFRSFEIKEEG